jgi:hypothetical protein
MSRKPSTPDLPTLAKLKLGEYDLNVDFYMKMDYVDATSACKELPAIIEYVNEHLMWAVEDMMKAKQSYREAYGEGFAFLKDKDHWAERGLVGNPTDKGVETQIPREPYVREAAHNLAYATAWVGRLRQLIASLEAKLGMVRTSEATRRVMIEDEDRPSEQ